MSDVLDTLAVKAAEGDQGAISSFWREAMSLEHWWFIARLDASKSLSEEMKHGRWPGVATGIVHGQEYAMGFTDEKRAVLAAGRGKIVDATGRAPIVKMPRGHAVALLSQLASIQLADEVAGVTGLMLNYSDGTDGLVSGGVSMPLDSIAAAEMWYHERFDDGIWDAGVRSISSANKPAGWLMLARRLAGLDEIWTIAEHGKPGTIKVVDIGEAFCVVVCTSQERLGHAAESGAFGDVGDELTGWATTPRALAKQLSELQISSKGHVKTVVVNLGGMGTWSLSVDQFVGIAG